MSRLSDLEKKVEEIATTLSISSFWHRPAPTVIVCEVLKTVETYVLGKYEFRIQFVQDALGSGYYYVDCKAKREKLYSMSPCRYSDVGYARKDLLELAAKLVK